MIIAIANQKGGVGKTTTAVTIAAAMALQGKPTLLIDLDSQGNCADSLGIESGNDLGDFILKVYSQYPRVEAREHLTLIRSDKNTTALKMTLTGMEFRERLLADRLASAADEYHSVILDCAPSVDILHTAALFAADYLLIPTKLDQFSVKGVGELLRSLHSAQRYGSPCQMLAILPTFFDHVTLESAAQLRNVVGAFGSLVWPVIPVDTSVRIAHRAGKTIWEHCPNGRASQAYIQVMDHLREVL